MQMGPRKADISDPMDNCCRFERNSGPRAARGKERKGLELLEICPDLGTRPIFRPDRQSQA